MEKYYEYMHIDKIEKDFLCQFCAKPFVQPVLTPNGETYFRQCAETKLDGKYSKNELTSVIDVSMLDILDKMLVRCVLCNQENLERNLFENHLMTECPKAIVSCPIVKNKCTWIGLREELLEHLEECSHEIIDRKNSIGNILPFDEIQIQERYFNNQNIALTVKALIINKRCKTMDLFNKNLSSQGASIIASVLNNDTYLETLSLRNNLICDSGVQFLAHALSSNAHLQRLDLNENSITDTGVSLLINMLKVNQTLMKLTLSFNRITNEGLSLLINVLLNDNSTLQWLCLTGNTAINDACRHSIYELIRTNRSLKILNLEECSFTNWVKTKIYLRLSVHPKANLEILL